MYRSQNKSEQERIRVAYEYSIVVLSAARSDLLVYQRIHTLRIDCMRKFTRQNDISPGTCSLM